MFDVNRDYKELMEILDIQRVDKTDILPCDETGAAADDDDDDIDDLPGNETGVTGVAVDDDDIVTYLVVTSNSKGDLVR